MADDHNQRPYRSNDLPMRAAPVAAPGPAGGDPLAELARLIGQNDPFAEFGRDGVRRGAPQHPAEAAADWSAPPAGSGYPPQAPPAGANYGANEYYGATAAPAHPAEMPAFAPPPPPRQGYGRPAYAAGADPYRGGHEVPGYGANHPGAHPNGYDSGPYYPNQMHHGDDGYDEGPPPRRRMGVMAIAAVFALAVIGTAGAFGYRALFGSSGTSGPPPVIKADASPSKIVPPAKTKDVANNKMIYDRVADRGNGEKIVSREEQPVAAQAKPAAFPASQATQANAAAMMGSGIVGMEPKKVHTIAIRPDQAGTDLNAPPVAAPAPARTAATAPVRQSAPRVASNPQPAADPPPRQSMVANAAEPVRRSAEPVQSNAPLSLNPDAPAAAPARAPARVTRTTAAPPPTQIVPPSATHTRTAAVGSTGAYAVQVSSQRSEAEAQTAFQTLQAKFPGQLGGRNPMIHRVDLGEKGIYFRAMVGPFASSNEAGELCSSLKAAGGNCIVQRN